MKSTFFWHLNYPNKICQAENIKLVFQKEKQRLEKSNNFLLFVTPK